MLVFVYGTLKKGYRLNRALASSEFLGTGTTFDKFKMYNLGSFPMVTREDEIAQVLGEIYRVSEQVLSNLDAIEGHPGFYRRTEIKVLDEHAEIQDAYIYLGPEDGPNSRYAVEISPKDGVLEYA